MKFSLAVIVALGLAGAVGAEPILGVWQTERDGEGFAHVTIKPCGGAFCGTITKTFGAQGETASEYDGQEIVRAMVPTGNGNYKGKVWRPSNNKVYIGKVQISGDTMKLSGCVAGGLICAKQDWTRIR